jgi:hypothetical protein
LRIADPNNLNNGCGGALTAAPRTTFISLVNGSLAANASCTISLDLQVTATTAGVLTSPAVNLSNNQGLNATAAAINLTVTVPAPNFTMEFQPNPIQVQLTGNPAQVTPDGTLTFTITNNAAVTLTGLAFRHALPIELQVNPATNNPGTTVSCGPNRNASIQRPANRPNIIEFTGGSVAPGETCVVDVPVQTARPLNQRGIYRYPNSSVRLTNNESDPVTAGPVTWTVVVN